MQAETQQTDAPATLPTSAEGQIAASLKQLYGQMLGEPMPDRFATLLSELARAERNNEGQS